MTKVQIYNEVEKQINAAIAELKKEGIIYQLGNKNGLNAKFDKNNYQNETHNR